MGGGDRPLTKKRVSIEMAAHPGRLGSVASADRVHGRRMWETSKVGTGLAGGRPGNVHSGRSRQT